MKVRPQLLLGFFVGTETPVGAFVAPPSQQLIGAGAASGGRAPRASRSDVSSGQRYRKWKLLTLLFISC